MQEDGGRCTRTECAVTGFPGATLFLPGSATDGIYLSPALLSAARHFLVGFYYCGPTYGGHTYSVSVYTEDPLLSFLDGSTFVLSEHPEGVAEHHSLCLRLYMASHESPGTTGINRKHISGRLRYLLQAGDRAPWCPIRTTMSASTQTPEDPSSSPPNRKARRDAARLAEGPLGRQEAQ